MNTILAVGQVVVSVGLVAFVLLQARGAGLSSAFEIGRASCRERV